MTSCGVFTSLKLIMFRFDGNYSLMFRRSKEKLGLKIFTFVRENIFYPMIVVFFSE